jgi:hypothetical protein
MAKLQELREKVDTGETAYRVTEEAEPGHEREQVYRSSDGTYHYWSAGTEDIPLKTWEELVHIAEIFVGTDNGDFDYMVMMWEIKHESDQRAVDACLHP